MEQKYKVGDRVRIKNFDWFRNEGANMVVTYMTKYYGEVVTIKSAHKGFYRIKEDGGQYCWIDEMFECKVEEESKTEIKFKVGDKITHGKDTLTILNILFDKYVVEDNFGECGILYFNSQGGWKIVEEEAKPKYEDEVNGEYYSTPKYLVRPSGYQFKDENGNVINATKIVLEKKKKEYPKLFVDCCAILYPNDNFQIVSQRVKGHKGDLLFHFQKLLICRDAYWQIAGAEMGLEKPWEPDWNIRGYYAIARSYGNVVKTSNYNCDLTFVFPTEEMRDAFYENFKEEIEKCKEFL